MEYLVEAGRQLVADLLADMADELASVAPGSTSDERTWRPPTSWRRASLKTPTPCLVIW